MEYYTEEGTSSLNNTDSRSQLQYDDDEDDYCKYRREQIFNEVDYTKRKTKIACSLG
jgi:hypothetical protein